MRKLFAFILLWIFAFVRGQSYEGEIYISEHSNYYLNQIYVTNLTEYKTVRVDPSGKFKIRAKVGDIIRFTSIITDRKDIKITEHQLKNSTNFVELKIAYYDIQEVVITHFKPTGNLRRDVLSLKTNEKELALKKAIGLPEPKGNGLTTQLPLASFANGGLTFGLNNIYNLISGEKKKKERLQKYEQMNIAISNIRKYYGTKYFDNLKIPENLIDNFLQFVYSSDNILTYIQSNNYDAIAFYIEKYVPIYQKRLKNSSLMEVIE